MSLKHFKLLTKQVSPISTVNSVQWSRYMSVLAKSIKYTQHGEPADVLQMVEEKLEKPQKNQVLVKILAAPINPADINTIQGENVIKHLHIIII